MQKVLGQQMGRSPGHGRKEKESLFVDSRAFRQRSSNDGIHLTGNENKVNHFHVADGDKIHSECKKGGL